MKRYEKFVFEAEKGITFEVSEGTRSGELVIRAKNIVDNETNDGCSENYVNPHIPEGYEHICGEWNNGFVIQRYFDGSQFTWIPVESLETYETPDSVRFFEKYGKRNYLRKDCDLKYLYENFGWKFVEQRKSVKKYGGFYVSSHNISKSRKGRPQSVKGVMPWSDIGFEEAKKVAATIEDNEEVKSHLLFNAEYDSILEWLISSGARTYKEIVEDSSNWGNYKNTENSKIEFITTGSCEEYCSNNIYDIAGSVKEWVESCDNAVTRGGSFYNNVPAVFNHGCFSYLEYTIDVGFRVALYMK